MLITLFIFFAVIGLALNALFLHLTSKLLKVELSNYKTALIITVTQLAITFIIGASVDFLLTLAGLKYADSVLSIFISFAVFHLLLQKYYKTSLQKNILIYIIFTIITVVISLSIIIPTRIFILEPFYVAGETMNPTLH